MGYREPNINDSLTEIGKDFRNTRRNIEYVSQRFSENLPIVEKSLDRLGKLYTFRMHFYTYTPKYSVTLDIEFFEKFVSAYYTEG